jgi:sugar lactone lactonase YvrE
VDELIHATIHDALDIQEPAGLRARVIRAVPMDRPGRRHWRLPTVSGQWAAGLAAIVVTAALLIALAGTRIGSHPASPGPVGPGLRLTNPSGIAVAADGTVYVADYNHSRVYRVRPDGALVVVAGGGSLAEGPGPQSNIFGPMALQFDSDGNLLIAENAGTSIGRLDPNGNLTTVYSSFGRVWGLAISPSGPLYASLSDRVAAILPGTQSPVDLSSVPGPVVWPGYIAFDARGNLYVADLAPVRTSIQLTPPAPGGCRIIRVAPDNSVSVIAGTGQCGYSGDGGPAVNAKLDDPNGIAFDPAGNLYFADSNNERIRKIDTRGVITTVAGNGAGGHTGDNGPALNARLGQMSGVQIANGRYLYFAEDSGGMNSYGAVRVVDLRTGIIRTVVDSYSRVVS